MEEEGDGKSREAAEKRRRDERVRDDGGVRRMTRRSVSVPTLVR